MSTTFNVCDLIPFADGADNIEELDLRTNPFQEGGLDMSDESLMMGDGWAPLVVRSFRFSRCDLTKRRDMTSDGAT